MNEPVAQNAVEFNDESCFLLREAATLQVRSEIVYPSQSTALSTSLKAYNSKQEKHYIVKQMMSLW